MTAGRSEGEPNHGLRIALIWAGVSVILVLLVLLVLGPQIPPFDRNVQSHDQHTVNVVLTTLATPVAALIWVFFGYSIVFFRQQGDTIVDGPPITGNSRIQITWLAVTAVLVLSLAAYGTIRLFGSSNGAGGGQGPNPLAKPANAGQALQIQVIGQQWLWTFRYPSYGGVETPELALPVNREVEFHVTSLDVDHSFWAYELGVKADAIPGSDNVAFLKALQTGSFQIRCAELCGLWHGAMFNSGEVMTDAAFRSWATGTETQLTAATKVLPPYSLTYSPNELKGLAKLYPAAGINGAGGDYYGLNYPNQP
jgi:cytochrome c oxidase subunit 2